MAVRLRQFAARRARLAQAAFRPFSTRAWTSAIIDRGNICIRWPDRHGPVQRTSGPFPDVPVLVISGDLDPNVPTAEGRQAARQFPHAQVVEVPNAWHGPEREPTGCALSITSDFIRNQRLGDTSCLAKSRPCRWTERALPTARTRPLKKRLRTGGRSGAAYPRRRGATFGGCTARHGQHGGPATSREHGVRPGRRAARLEP